MNVKAERQFISQALEGIVEALAAIEHERWSHWQRYLHSKGFRQSDGSLILPADLVDRWERQILTPYDELGADEKESDREQVRIYLALIESTLTNFKLSE